VRPERPDDRLLISSLGRCGDAIAAKALDLVVRRGIASARERRRHWRAKLRSPLHDERRDGSPLRSERKWHQTDPVLSPDAWTVSGAVLLDGQFFVLRSVARARAEDLRRRAPADRDSTAFRPRIWNQSEVCGEFLVEVILLGRKDGDERIVRGLRDRRV